jgi:peroxiredoxin
MTGRTQATMAVLSVHGGTGIEQGERSRRRLGVRSQIARRLLLAALVACGLGVGSAQADDPPPGPDGIKAGHSTHGEVFNEGPRQAAYRIEGAGRVRCVQGSNRPEVQALLHQGLGQLHGFWYFEAERTYRQAAALEPDCALAYWGMAMANANNRDRAKKFLEEASQRKDKSSAHVRLYIEALEGLLKNDDENVASQEYVKKLEAILYDHPDDIEAKAFLALQLWQRRDKQKPFSHIAVDQLLQQVLDVEPMHPVHHYRIHLWDADKPERALASAALCGQSAPDVAHMWHMPGHTYSRLNRFVDAVWQQEASARTDHARMMRDRLLPDQIHNFAHNNEWLIRNLVFLGRLRDGIDLAINMIELPRHPKYNMVAKDGCSASYGRQRLMQVLHVGELWEETLRLANTPYLDATDVPKEQVAWHRMVGRAAYRLGRETEGDQQLAELAARLCEKQAERRMAMLNAEKEARAAGKNAEEITKAGVEAGDRLRGDLEPIERAVQELETLRLADDDRWADALKRTEGGHDLDAFWLARLHLHAGQPDQAIEKLRERVKAEPQATLPLAHLADLQWRLGRLHEARETLEKLQAISAHIDLDAPPFARLAPLAAQCGWNRDWRGTWQPSTDVGARPELDSLGPIRWQPQPVAPWSLVNVAGQTVSLSDYQGRPIVILFYLGSGCLHCAEQLQAFGPQTEAFRAAGIELLAISSDNGDGLKKSLENYQGGLIPFPLLADPELAVFKQYRAFDDFENKPLHGTFLVDGAGQLRWHDIGHEPFMDHGFVLAEAKRLLNVQSAPAAKPLAVPGLTPPVAVSQNGGR